MVRTARPLNLRAGDWVTNGVGRNVSHSFGFGLMDAGAMVKLASNWTTVPEQHKCTIAYPARYKQVIFLFFFFVVPYCFSIVVEILYAF